MSFLTVLDALELERKDLVQLLHAPSRLKDQKKQKLSLIFECNLYLLLIDFLRTLFEFV